MASVREVEAHSVTEERVGLATRHGQRRLGERDAFAVVLVQHLEQTLLVGGRQLPDVRIHRVGQLIDRPEHLATLLMTQHAVARHVVAVKQHAQVGQKLWRHRGQQIVVALALHEHVFAAHLVSELRVDLGHRRPYLVPHEAGHEENDDSSSQAPPPAIETCQVRSHEGLGTQPGIVDAVGCDPVLQLTRRQHDEANGRER
mmetsp:Transcript_83465/g.170237  ORF Transcript_83465/g.170237 Transcript_83465/m.170237 type:complete len:201 (+) Transcript_83465:329-931(+)